jgi:hypothetical protein
LDDDSALGDGEHAGDQFVAKQSGKQTKYTNRTISMLHTSNRSDKDVQIMLTRSQSIVRSAAKVESNKMLVGPERSDLDSHAVTCVVGAAYRVLELVGPTCDVHPYLSEYAPIKNVPIVTATTAYS